MHSFIIMKKTHPYQPKRGGVGKESHERPFLNSIYNLDKALREAVLDKAPHKFEVHAAFPRLTLSSMLRQTWRPQADEIESLRNWRVSEEVAELLTTGAWSYP